MAESIIVTGAAGVLGRAVVAELAQGGAKVIAVDVAKDIGGVGQAASVGGVDLTDAGATEAAYAGIVAEHGPLAGLANIAGGFRWEDVTGGSVDTWDLLYKMNVRTTLNSSKAALAGLAQGGGAIVNVGAAGAVRAAHGMGAYAASKAGVMRLTEALAEEYKDKGVRVNAVLPSIIDTPVNRADMPDAEFSRWVTPEALAGVIAFLLSDKASAITGALIPVTGRV
ncbi:SDR family oxidoreductase [Sphingomonas bacterium]|uniref:SDR family oxidoreductase n=1 Tax=Sphingomonas bacterium TaxID=1895847 RepID=UPI00157765BD|nr:SDR family oxidoreductase [Sphingomonas bacterium]